MPPLAADRRAAALVVCIIVLGLITTLFIQRTGTHLGVQSVPRIERFWGPKPQDRCAAYLGWKVTVPFSVILTADPGDFSGTPEVHFILANLKHMEQKLGNETVCRGHFQGLLMGQPVLAVITGIGPVASAVCTLEVATACGDWITEILYFGTSGWSPQLGGILNPDNCSTANDNMQITRVGDVCVSPFTVDWTCKKATWLMQARGHPNECFKPEDVAGPAATPLFGECMFGADNHLANIKLSDEVIAAAQSARGSANFPHRNLNVSCLEQRYWAVMANGTGIKYPIPDAHHPPTIWTHQQCMEVDGRFFYSGAPWEVTARGYVAETLGSVMRFSGKQAKTTHDVIAVSAMEGIGVSEAMLKYHMLSTTRRKIPYTNASPGLWQTFHELPEDFINGYAYAIASGSAAILTFYQQRCLRQLAEGSLPATTDCSFSIDYNTKVALYARAVALARAGHSG